MYLKNIIAFIQPKFDELSRREKLNSKEKAYMFALNTILILLIESENGKNLDKLEEVLRFIQRIPISHFLTTIPFGKDLQNDDHEVLPCYDMSPALGVGLSSTQKQVLGTIHVNLMKYYNRIKNRTWYFAYPKDSEDHVMNDAVMEWQTIQMQVKSGSHAAYGDFKRNVSIEGKCGGNKHDVKKRIKQLVNHAYGYDTDDNNDPAENKKILEEWLAANGGQSNYGFVHLSIQKNHFTEGTEGEEAIIGSAKGASSNWSVDKNGKICMEFSFIIHSIKYDTGAVVLQTQNGEVHKVTCPFEVVDELERFKKMKDAGKELPTLLAVNAKIQLDIMEGKVQPNVVDYNVTSFTEELLSPERLFCEKVIKLHN